MRQSLFFKEIIPFILLFLLLIFLTIFFDFILHYFNVVWLGRYMGFFGLILIAISFLKSARKREIIFWIPSKYLINFHEYLSWTGGAMILVHGGIHLNALLPWLAISTLLMVMFSGLTGKYLLRRCGKFLIFKERQLQQRGIQQEEIKKILYVEIQAMNAMQNWKKIHIFMTILLFVLISFHILTVSMFWR